MVQPQRAVVVPRVLSEISGDSFPVEEVVAERLGGAGSIALRGESGMGTSTALAHLAAVFGSAVTVLDADATAAEISVAARRGLVVHGNPRSREAERVATLRLAPWGVDEALEYMMAAHPDACASVLPQLLADPERVLLGETPELWRAALDRMAAGAPGVAAALAEIANGVRHDDELLRHRVICIFRRAHRIALDARLPTEWKTLASPAVPEVLREAARLLARAPAARASLNALCRGATDPRQPMAASLLLAMDPAWRPTGVPLLSGAHLARARWRGIDLHGVQLAHSDLARADLSAGIFDEAYAIRVSFRRARLPGASFNRAQLAGSDFRRADLAGATFRHATIDECDLRGARLPGADLSYAALRKAQLSRADCSGAIFTGAYGDGLDLRRTRLDGARFTHARLLHCRLQGVRLLDAHFDGAQMCGAELTGSELPAVSFHGADLRGAKLAEVSWEGADLRNADLREADFHMGSSRSGLVESDFASEGTRTGFYTDDYDEQHFKAPEEIRKANLRGADLRGAKIADTDFYLVDLRDVRCDPEQERHFQRCGAILGIRTDRGS